MQPLVQSVAEYQELLIDTQWQLVRADGKLFAHKRIGQVKNGDTLQHVLGSLWNRDVKRMCVDALERGLSSQNVFERIRHGVMLALSFACLPSIENGRIGGFVLQIKDVTAQKRLEAQRELRDRMQMISQVASTVGHKMNGPIAAVLNRIGGILMDGNGSNNAAALRREMQMIQEQLYSISLITTGLAAFSNGNSKEHKLVQVNTIVQNAMHLMKLVDSEHHINFQIELDKNLPRILGDDVTLEQCIVNICKNSVEAMPNGGTVSLTTKVDEQFDDFISITISDDGPGMTAETLEHAFEPFYTTKAPQHGLGLSVSFAVVSSHNGGIELSSQNSVGTTAQIILPIAKLN